MYLVDETLNMVLRYDISFLRNEQGVSSWNVKNIRLLDNL